MIMYALIMAGVLGLRLLDLFEDFVPRVIAMTAGDTITMVEVTAA